MRTAAAHKLPRPLRWLYPGLGVKRWYALMLVGMACLGLGVLLLFNLFAPDLVALVGSANVWWAGPLLIVLGLAVVATGVNGVVRAVARAVLPSRDTQLVDVMLSRRSRGELRVTCVGGGTGLATLLRGLKLHTDNLAAVVTVSDDGGSSGRLREELNMLAPGDVRNCLVALADSEPLMTRLFDFRFGEEEGNLAGHSFGNLFIGALTRVSDGDFMQAVRDSSHILAIRGEVLPPTVEPVTLWAHLRTGEDVRGETAVASSHGQVEYCYLDPPAPRVLPEVLEALDRAELVVIGPGSVYTSLVPNLLVPGLAQRLADLLVPRIYVCNVMTQPGETDGFGAVDHVQALLAHAKESVFDYVLLNTRRPGEDVIARYLGEGAEFVDPDARGIARLGCVPVCGDLIAEGSWARHDPTKLAKAILELVAEHR